MLPGSRAAPAGRKCSGPSDSRESSDELDIDETASDMSMSPQGSSLPAGDGQQEEEGKGSKLPIGMLVHMGSGPSGNMANSTLLFTDVADFQQILQFPSLRTTTTVSWCFLNYTKPNFVQQATFKSSVYASWCISSCNPNPSGLNTKTTLALLRSKQKITTEIYTLAAMHRPGTGKLTSSSAWKQFSQVISAVWESTLCCIDDCQTDYTVRSLRSGLEESSSSLASPRDGRSPQNSKYVLHSGAVKFSH